MRLYPYETINYNETILLRGHIILRGMIQQWSCDSWTTVHRIPVLTGFVQLSLAAVVRLVILLLDPSNLDVDIGSYVAWWAGNTNRYDKNKYYSALKKNNKTIIRCRYMQQCSRRATTLPTRWTTIRATRWTTIRATRWTTIRATTQVNYHSGYHSGELPFRATTQVNYHSGYHSGELAIRLPVSLGYRSG